MIESVGKDEEGSKIVSGEVTEDKLKAGHESFERSTSDEAIIIVASDGPEKGHESSLRGKQDSEGSEKGHESLLGDKLSEATQEQGEVTQEEKDRQVVELLKGELTMTKQMSKNMGEIDRQNEFVTINTMTETPDLEGSEREDRKKKTLWRCRSMVSIDAICT
jgi:hypothetical protein